MIFLKSVHTSVNMALTAFLSHDYKFSDNERGYNFTLRASRVDEDSIDYREMFVQKTRFW